MYGGRVEGGKKVGGREEERKAKVWPVKVRMETKGWRLETDEAVSGGGEGELGKGRAEAMNRSGERGGARRRTYSKTNGAPVLSGYRWIHEELTSVSGSWPCEMGLVHKSRFIHE